MVAGIVALRGGDSGESGAGGAGDRGRPAGETTTGDDAPSDAEGGGWVSEAHGNSQGLVSSGEQVCSTTFTGTLYCLDATTGQERFHQELGGSVTSPVLVDDTLLVGVADGGQYGLHAYSLDGDQLWTAPIELGSADQLPVVDGVVGVVDGLTTGQLVGIDAATGEERWRTFTDDAPDAPALIGSPLTDGERFYVGLQSYEDDVEAWVAAIDPASGDELWRAPLGPELAAFLGFEDVAAPDDAGTVTLVGRGGDTSDQLVVLDAASGEILRQVPLTSNYGSLLQVDDTTLVADGPSLVAFGPDGEGRWEVPSPGALRDPTLGEFAQLVGDGDRVFLVGHDVFEIDPMSGDGRAVAEGVSATDVALVDGLLVVAGMSQLEALPLAG